MNGKPSLTWQRKAFLWNSDDLYLEPCQSGYQNPLCGSFCSLWRAVSTDDIYRPRLPQDWFLIVTSKTSGKESKVETGEWKPLDYIES